jgi:hypothetical protein
MKILKLKKLKLSLNVQFKIALNKANIKFLRHNYLLVIYFAIKSLKDKNNYEIIDWIKIRDNFNFFF